MKKEPYRDGFRPKKRQGRILRQRFFRTVVMLSKEQMAWLKTEALSRGVSVSALIRKLIDAESGGSGESLAGKLEVPQFFGVGQAELTFQRQKCVNKNMRAVVLSK